MNYDAYSQLILAYSGGLDSHVLLHQLAQYPTTKSKLHVVHINHGLSPNADQWQAHCATVCSELKVPFTTIKITIDIKPGDSLEAVAREQRYAELAKFVDENTALLTAQHQDDQAETILLQLFRGAGVKGLAAMPEQKLFANGVQLRPLLNTTRAELAAYALQYDLQWIEDESNKNLNFNRNYLRQTIMPLLKQRWPSITSTLARSSQHCAEAAELLSELAKIDYQICAGSQLNCLNIIALQQLSRARKINTLRYWLKLNNVRSPNKKHLEKIIDEVIAAKSVTTPLLRWENIVMRRNNSELFFVINQY
jgi:tRNA(Ile)-lysidine synthase